MLRLIEDPAPDELVRELEKLIDDIRNKRVTGVAYIALGPRKYYRADAMGLAVEDPIRTRGTLFALAAKLEEITLRRSR